MIGIQGKQAKDFRRPPEKETPFGDYLQKHEMKQKKGMPYKYFFADYKGFRLLALYLKIYNQEGP